MLFLSCYHIHFYIFESFFLICHNMINIKQKNVEQGELAKDHTLLKTFSRCPTNNFQFNFIGQNLVTWPCPAVSVKHAKFLRTHYPGFAYYAIRGKWPLGGSVAYAAYWKQRGRSLLMWLFRCNLNKQPRDF